MGTYGITLSIAVMKYHDITASWRGNGLFYSQFHIAAHYQK